MNTATSRKSYYLQTRTGDRSWELVGKGWANANTALDHFRALAEVSYPHVTLRVMTGNPFSGEISEVIATRQGGRAHA